MLGKLLVCAIGMFMVTAGFAQSWPNRPVRVLVGYTASSSPDLVARVTAVEIGKRLGQPMVVEDRPGGGGAIAAVAVARADKDGYTVLLAGPLTGYHPSLTKDDPVVLGKDLTPLGGLAATPWAVIVRTSLGVKNLQELVAYSKANPGKLNFGSVSVLIDIFAEALKQKTGLTFTSVRYKGQPTAELLRGEVDFFLGTMSNLDAQVQAGKIAPIVFFAKSTDYPNVPTSQDLGLFTAPVRATYAYHGPMGLPRDIVQKFSQALLAASSTPELTGGIRKLGLEMLVQTPEQVMSEYEAATALFVDTARSINFKPE